VLFVVGLLAESDENGQKTSKYDTYYKSKLQQQTSLSGEQMLSSSVVQSEVTENAKNQSG